jgi:catechol-2,3-dioxygenase
MKRMHLHLAVEDLKQSIRFYNSLFGVSPTVLKTDYAKWMLDDPLVNFAISTRSKQIGLDHIGIQAENESELNEIKTRLEAAEMEMVSQASTTCCYAKSDKHWVQDPSGIAWETYHTLENAPTFNGQTENTVSPESNNACCAPAPQVINLISKNKGGQCK